jgi:NAD(P)-dependent dehydrogenase (short-subunit alcohol dehydrogenase family)
LISLLDLVQEVERVAGLAVELVDKSEDRHVAQPADHEELAGLLLPLAASSTGAAKAAISRYTRYLAQDLGPFGSRPTAPRPV